jgi:uncharacterized membrane protein YeaQ/YmgE (transglycosylase-associated protein family)
LEAILSLSTWIVLGIVSGFVVNKITSRSSEGLLREIVLGIAGAVVGGSLFSTSGMADGSGANVYSFVVVVVGAMGALVTYHLLVRNSR